MKLARILRFVPILGLVVMALASLAAIRVPLQPTNPAPAVEKIGPTTAFDSGIAPTLRISIPFGINPSVHPFADGRELRVRGHGGCEPGDTYDVEVTVTQQQEAATAEATGSIEDAPCEPYVFWHTTATADAYSPAFVDGAAEVCAVAYNYDAVTGEVIDEQEWCQSVIIGPYEQYLPTILRIPSS